MINIDPTTLFKSKCHIHRDGYCKIAYNENNQYHFIPVSSIDTFAAGFNKTSKTNEFCELLEDGNYTTPISDSEWKKDKDFINECFSLLRYLDENGIIYIDRKSPVDFATKHIITDGKGRVHLCNRHLFKQCKPQVRYSSDTFKRKLLCVLFPAINSTKKAIPSDTPPWIFSFINQK